MAPARGTAGEVRLLLDEMHSPAVAAALSSADMEILAVAGTAELRGRSDADILTYAATNGYTVVTENVADVSILHGQWLVAGRAHAGLVFTSARRFDRASLSYPGVLIAALRAFSTRYPGGIDGTVVWLESA